MEKSSVLHIPKSNYSYASKSDELTIWIRTKKDDIDKVYIKYTDPFYSETISLDINIVEMKREYQTILFDYYRIKIKTITKRTRYIFILQTNNNFYYYGAKEFQKIAQLSDNDKDLFNYFNFPFINNEDISKAPQWSKEIVWYQIFIDRFHTTKYNELKWNSKEHVSNSDIFGGNILGIIDKLDYLKDLGIGGIYFTPLFQATSVHKYDTVDYYKIDSSFGTNDDFKLLVNTAHKKGIKIMLDIVFNHCGINHPFFQDVIQNKKESKYYNFFMFYDESDNIFINNKPNYHTFAFTPNMPKLNTANKEVRKYLLDVAKYWIENYDIDGYRLDVSNEVSHLFWKEFCNLSKSIKSDFVIIGENWDNSLPWLGVDQFDSVMNYELYYPLINFFAEDKINSVEFVSMINELIVSYPENYLTSMFNLLGCHDTIRIKTACNGNEQLTKLAYIFLFSFTGCPNIYYGDEIGLNGNKDPDNRRCMDWNLIDNDFYKFIKKLISIRKHNISTFTSVDINWISITDNILIYNKENIFIIINKNNYIINVPSVMNGQYINLFTDEEITIDNAFILNNFQYLIIKRI